MRYNTSSYLVLGLCFFYKSIFEGFVPRVETTDLDLYLPNPKKAKSNNLYEKLRVLSYIKNNDYLSGKTTYISATGFEIEFITKPDRSMSSTLSIPGFSVVAEALPKMAPSGWNYVEVQFNSLKVNVVSPVSFVLQKLLINKARIPIEKRAKDIDAVKYVIQFVKASSKYNQELVESLEKYPKKWVKTIKAVAQENNIELI